MAEGGHFGYDDPDLDYKIDHDDDDDDEQEVNTTSQFQPGRASTPYHGGEQFEMQTMHDDQTGMEETSYEEDPLLSRPDPIGERLQESLLRQKMKKSVDMILAKHSKADIEKLKIRRGKGKGSGKIVAIRPKGGQYQIIKNDESGLLRSFTEAFKRILGPTAEEIIAEDRDTIQEQRQRVEEAEKQQREAEKIAAEREKELRETENLKQKEDRAQARIDAIQEEHGSNLEGEAELRRLKQLKKNYQTEYEKKKKEVAALGRRKGFKRKREARRNCKKKKSYRRKAEQHQTFR